MKKTTFLFMTLFFCLMLSNCGTKKVIAPPETTITPEPFSSKEYFSDDDYYRASSSGSASNESTAHARARDNALAELVSEIKTLVERGATAFDSEKDVQANSFDSSEYTLKIVTYVKKNLPNPRTIGKTIGKKENGEFKAYRALEVKKTDLINMLKEISETDLKKLEIIKQQHDEIIENVKKAN